MEHDEFGLRSRRIRASDKCQEHQAAKEILKPWSRTMSEARPRSAKKQLQNSARGRTEGQPGSAIAERQRHKGQLAQLQRKATVRVAAMAGTSVTERMQ